MRAYKIQYKEVKEGGKCGVYNVEVEGMLTKSKMIEIIKKKFPNLGEIIIWRYDFEDVDKKSKKPFLENIRRYSMLYPHVKA